jgi:hypothetical protein
MSRNASPVPVRRERSSSTGPSLYYEKGTGKRVETIGELDIVRSISIPADLPFPL